MNEVINILIRISKECRNFDFKKILVKKKQQRNESMAYSSSIAYDTVLFRKNKNEIKRNYKKTKILTQKPGFVITESAWYAAY